MPAARRNVSRFRDGWFSRGARSLVQRRNGRFSFELCAAKALGELAIKSYTKKAGGAKEMFHPRKVRFEPNDGRIQGRGWYCNEHGRCSHPEEKT